MPGSDLLNLGQPAQPVPAGIVFRAIIPSNRSQTRNQGELFPVSGHGIPAGLEEVLMSDRLVFIRLPLVLLGLYFIGKLVVGAAGGSYELGNRLFAMVPLTVHLCLIWGAVGRAYRGIGAGGAAVNGILISLFAQVLIFGATMMSYLVGLDTHFSNPVAIVGQDIEVSLGQAFMGRLTGLIANSILGAVMGLIGFGLGSLLPGRQR